MEVKEDLDPEKYFNEELYNEVKQKRINLLKNF